MSLVRIQVETNNGLQIIVEQENCLVSLGGDPDLNARELLDFCVDRIYKALDQQDGES